MRTELQSTPQANPTATPNKATFPPKRVNAAKVEIDLDAHWPDGETDVSLVIDALTEFRDTQLNEIQEELTFMVENPGKSDLAKSITSGPIAMAQNRVKRLNIYIGILESELEIAYRHACSERNALRAK